jgi:hypothetical protein
LGELLIGPLSFPADKNERGHGRRTGEMKATPLDLYLYFCCFGSQYVTEYEIEFWTAIFWFDGSIVNSSAQPEVEKHYFKPID